jgi:hypothetical protein
MNAKTIKPAAPKKAMQLDEEIAARRAEVKTDSYPMSIGELASVYRSGELNLNPQFQRFFRWNEEQKSRLVESILLGIPIPSIFVSQRQDGKWDVVDGLQRLSTIFEVMGILKDREGKIAPRLVLSKTKHLPSLEGKVWPKPDEAPPYSNSNVLSEEAQLLIKRAKLDLKIVLRESSESSKYELFQRLNTGGAVTSDQEIRNCILIMVSPPFFEWTLRLSELRAFRECLALTDAAEDKQFGLELVTRFLVLRSIDEQNLRSIGDLKELLDDSIVRFAEDSGYDKTAEESAFRKTFEVLSAATGDDSFRHYDQKLKRFKGKFLVSAFEAIACGLGFHLGAGGILEVSEVENRIKTVWSSKSFLNGIGSGVRASTRIPVTIKFGRTHFKP